MIRVTILQKLKNLQAKMYGKKNLKKIVDVRTEIFMEKCKSKTDGGKISCAKKLDSGIMLSCECVLLNKISLLTIHHSILGGNWSTETINYFGFKVIYH